MCKGSLSCQRNAKETIPAMGAWNAVVHTLQSELTLAFGDIQELTRVVLRLLFALAAGGVLGWERQRQGKVAGLRTHMLVALGAAAVVMVPQLHMGDDALSRVIQGTLTGIGFVGGGAILKSENEGQVHGVTTAAGLWLTAILGVTAGIGSLGLTTAGMALAFIILALLGRFEPLPNGRAHPRLELHDSDAKLKAGA